MPGQPPHRCASGRYTLMGGPPIIVVLSLALSLALLVFTRSAGRLTLTVLMMVPLALGDTVACSVNCTRLPLAMLTVTLIEPFPLAGQPEPAEARQVQAAFVRLAGSTSLTRTLVAVNGPVLLTWMV